MGDGRALGSSSCRPSTPRALSSRIFDGSPSDNNATARCLLLSIKLACLAGRLRKRASDFMNWKGGSPHCFVHWKLGIYRRALASVPSLSPSLSPFLRPILYMLRVWEREREGVPFRVVGAVVKYEEIWGGTGEDTSSVSSESDCRIAEEREPYQSDRDVTVTQSINQRSCSTGLSKLSFVECLLCLIFHIQRCFKCSIVKT